MNQLISGFNMQLIMYMSERIVTSIFRTEKHILDMRFYPKISILNVDDSPHLQTLNETLIMGSYMGGMGGSEDEQWAVYNVFDFHLPSETELAHMKAIIIPGATRSVYDLDSTPWLQQLTRFIQNVIENYEDIKLVGIGFGS